MRHASMSFSEVLAPDGGRGILTIKATGDGTGTVTYKRYGSKDPVHATLSEVARFLLVNKSGDKRCSNS